MRTITTESKRIIAICGTKQQGKSTVARLITSRLWRYGLAEPGDTEGHVELSSPLQAFGEYMFPCGPTANWRDTRVGEASALQFLGALGDFLASFDDRALVRRALATAMQRDSRTVVLSGIRTRAQMLFLRDLPNVRFLVCRWRIPESKPTAFEHWVANGTLPVPHTEVPFFKELSDLSAWVDQWTKDLVLCEVGSPAA